MNTSFWNHCQGLVRRLQNGRAMLRPRLRRKPSWNVESLETRTLLSSTPAMLADINPGAASSNAYDLVTIASTTYFTADDGVHGQELWKSDGTAAGTSLLADINPGGGSSGPVSLTNVNGTLFFTADDGLHGRELWKSDGTTSGTTMVEDLYPGSGGGISYGILTNANGTLFFTGSDGINGGLWKSDGTAAGTVPVSYAFPLSGALTTSVNGTLFFKYDDGIHGEELWKSDGTAAGTTMVKDITPWTTPSYYPISSHIHDLTNVNGTLFFGADDGVHGDELWKSDGTEAGTTLVKDIFPGTRTYYQWYGGSYTFPNSSSPRSLTNVNGILFFTAVADQAHGEELWKSDGTEAGTMLVKDTHPSELANVNGTLFFSAFNATSGDELWKSDGTAAGTTMVKDINPGSASSNRGELTNVNGTLFFDATDGTHGYELWKSNGTAAGTVMIADINPGSASSYPFNLTNANGTLFFAADDGIHGAELWTFPAVSGTPAPSLDVNGFPPITTAGAPGSFTVTARNADGTTNTGYTGTVQFSSTDALAIIKDPATGNPVALQNFKYTFTAADAGVHTFSATLKTAGTQSLTAADTQTSTINGTEGSILVKPAAASTMSVSGFPSSTTAGVAHNATVTLRDPYGNIASGYTGTVHFTSSDSKAILPVNYTFTAADAGSHTFSAILKTAGTRSITAADTLASALKATEGGITVNPAPASKFLISGPSSVGDGERFNLTITVADAYGNVVTGYTGTVHFTSTDNRATLPSNYTFTAADKGVHTFSGLVLRKRGKQTITIGDTLNSLLTDSVTENVR